uniref:Ribose 5-phosphate isomerase B n=1 Tax=candidate division WOR-3 bacterium TaxID=2052148 RepID=A0A7C4UGW0_UNCW3
MRIGLGCDHRGYELKEFIKKYLIEMNYEIVDFGTYTNDSVDYPDYAIPIGEKVAKGELDRGILICYSGIGMSIVANKVKGVYAALVHDKEEALLSRKHNNSNILVLSGKIDKDLAKEIVKIWLETEFEGGRHLRRLNKIKTYEERNYG